MRVASGCERADPTDQDPASKVDQPDAPYPTENPRKYEPMARSVLDAGPTEFWSKFNAD